MINTKSAFWLLAKIYSSFTIYHLSFFIASKRHFLVCLKGLEPPTSGLGNRCSILLSYRHMLGFCYLFSSFSAHNITYLLLMAFLLLIIYYLLLLAYYLFRCCLLSHAGIWSTKTRYSFPNLIDGKSFRLTKS